MKTKSQSEADATIEMGKEIKRLERICGHCSHWVTLHNTIPTPHPYCEFTRESATDAGGQTPWNYSCPKWQALKGGEPEKTITVCDKCLRASCWQGEFYCDDAKAAGTTEKTFTELQELALENPDHWRPELPGPKGG